MNDIWNELDELLGDLELEWQKPNEISIPDLMEHYGLTHGQARGRFAKLLSMGWKKKKVLRIGSGRPCVVAYKDEPC